MSVSSPYFEMTVGARLTCVVGNTSVFGGGSGKEYKGYDQPRWSAVTTPGISKVGYKEGASLAAGGTVTIDLQALDSPDGGSGTVSLATLRCLVIRITSTTGKLTIGNGGANAHLLDFGAAAHTRTLLPGGPGHLVGDPAGTGFVVDATHKDVKLANPHGTDPVSYVLLAGGT